MYTLLPSIRPVLSPILPARTVDAPRGLDTQSQDCQLKRKTGETRRKKCHLFVNPLPAVLALNGMLNDGVLGEALVQRREAVQREPNAHEVNESVEEESVFF